LPPFFIRSFLLCAWRRAVSALRAAPAAAAPVPPVRTGVFPFYAYAARYDVWRYLPMDQGGRLVQLQVIGLEADEKIARAVLTPGFFAPWGDPIRWDSLEKTEIEKSVWLNRWYFLPSLARRYYLTGDKAYLHPLITFVRKWRDENPLPVDYNAVCNWRDMQVAWRTENLAWSFSLAQDGFTAAEKRELYDVIALHARILLADFGGRSFESNQHPKNHQSHGAAAMLYAALLFPDLPEAAAMRDRAREILAEHLRSAFYPDGNSVELCPGYYPFMVSNFRDAYLLCRANGVPPPVGSEAKLGQFYEFLGQAMEPSGQMPPINDSSESDALLPIRILADLLGKPYPETGSSWFKDSHQAVMRDPTPETAAYVFLDAGPGILAHTHGGKLGFHLWFGDKPFVVDSGISDYDDPLKLAWYSRAEAHNVVLVDGEGDFDPNSTRLTEAGSSIDRWESNSRYDWAEMSHRGFASRAPAVAWTRDFILLKGVGALIVDRLKSTAEHDYTWLFHLLPCSPRLDDARKSAFTGFAEKNLLLQPASPESLEEMRLTTGSINRASRNYPAPVIRYTARGSSVAAAYFLCPVMESVAPEVRAERKVGGDGVTVELHGPFGSVRVELTAAGLNYVRM
jgi:hypothetical protein